MIQRFLTWIRGVFARMLHIDDAKRALHVDVAVSREMQKAIDLWAAMFLDDAPWLDDNTQSAGIAAAVASELARLTTVASTTSICLAIPTNSTGKKFLQRSSTMAIWSVMISSNRYSCHIRCILLSQIQKSSV